MNVKGDFKGNWKFFMWVNYEIITVLDKKQHEIRIALLDHKGHSQGLLSY